MIKQDYSMNSNGGNTKPQPGFYEDANLFLLEGHRTYMSDVEVLKQFPECVGALLADEMEGPNPFVVIYFDREKGLPIYRIARLGGGLKR